jgi:sulfite exporter TauE/SafE
MCGGIIGALTFSLPDEIRQHRLRLIAYLSAYSSGRILSYVIAGSLAAGIGNWLVTIISPKYGHLVLQSIAFIFMFSIGLFLAGWFPKFSSIEHIGQPVWSKLEPLGQKLLPVRNPLHAFLFGVIWGWLPCGLVYSALIWSSTIGSAMDGALFMLAFGAGTLPSVMAAGIVSDWIMRTRKQPIIRIIIGLSVMAMAVASLGFNLQNIDPAQHQHKNHSQ